MSTLSSSRKLRTNLLRWTVCFFTLFARGTIVQTTSQSLELDRIPASSSTHLPLMIFVICWGTTPLELCSWDPSLSLFSVLFSFYQHCNQKKKNNTPKNIYSLKRFRKMKAHVSRFFRGIYWWTASKWSLWTYPFLIGMLMIKKNT